MTKAYFIRGGSYARYDVDADAVDGGYPKPLTGGYIKIGGTGFEQGVDAALDLGQGKLYLFRGDSYLRIDNETNTVENQNSIAATWPGMGDAGFADSLDAAVNYENGSAFFFRGDSYVVYDIVSDMVTGGPFSIADDWPGLGDAGFADGLDAVVNWGTGKVYFFKADSYLRFDVASNAVDAGPSPIADNWPGLIPPFDGLDTGWVKLDAMPVAPLQPGDHVWWWDGKMSAAQDIPRLKWFPGSQNATDYLEHGKEIYQFVVHSDGSILRGQPHMRGFPGSQAWLNRNPGNIMGKAGGHDYGQYAGKFNWHSFMIFPTHDLGFAAIGTLLMSDTYRDLSLLDAFEKYAPAKDGNNPVQYATDVAAAAGVTPETAVGSLNSDQLLLVQQKIEAIEGTIPGDTYDAGSADLPEEFRALLG
jgi:hypothetical protein